MTEQQTETLIIGGGQAGLAVARQLQEFGRACLIVDGNRRVGDNWRVHYDSPRLSTPKRYCGLLGLPFPGRPVANESSIP